MLMTFDHHTPLFEGARDWFSSLLLNTAKFHSILWELAKLELTILLLTLLLYSGIKLV